MALTRSQDEVIIDLITNILRSSEKADVLPGQVLRDVVVNAPSTIISDIYNQINQLSLNQSISNANLMTTEALDNLVANFGIKRKGATNAFGQVTFYTPTLPTSNVTIPAGTSLGTNLGTTATEITFSTQFDIIFNIDLQGVYFNPNTGNYEISVNVIADNPGTTGDVGPFTITKIRNGNFPFNVTNRNATTGGVDQESNNDLAVRALNILLGSNIGTKTGYTGLVSSQNNILDTLVVGPGDPLMTRDGGFGGKVDIWTITSPAGIVELNPTSTPSLYISNWNWADQFTKGFIFDFPLLPVSTDGPINLVGTTTPSGNIVNVALYESRNPAPTGVTYMSPSGARYHYTVFIADDNETGHSDKANDHILWNPEEMEYLRTFNPSGTAFSGNILSVGITYSYDSTIPTVQAVVDSDSNHIITADVLVKEAEKILLDVTMDVQLLPAFKETAATLQQTIAAVEDAIATTINNTTLGNAVQESDLIQSAHNVTGVDNVIVSSVKILAKRSAFFDSTQQQITDQQAGPNQYYQSNTILVASV